jgi:archaellum biogenesis ATPase FlaH
MAMTTHRGGGAPDLKVVKGRGRGRTRSVGPDATLPVNPEAEAMAIGATLDWPAAAEWIPLLDPEDFDKPAHQLIWDVIRYELHARGRAVTTVAVDAELSARGQLTEVGGQAYILNLKERAQYLPAERDYARIVFERARDRALIRMSTEGAHYGYNSLEVEAAMLSLQAQVAEWQNRARAFSGESHTPGVLASEVEKSAIDWLWRGRLAYGKLSIVDGDPGMGKGLLGIDITARLTTGRAMPDEEPRARREPCSVILVTPEDEPNDTIVPRLEAAGADLARVRILNTITTDAVGLNEASERPVTFPRDLPYLEQAIEAMNARFVIIDPIMACLDAEVETKNDQKVRAALAPLKQLVARRQVACLVMRHLNKSGGDKAMYRGGGSIAFTGLARVAMLLAEHPDDDTQVALAVVKSNIATRKLATLGFTITTEYEDGAPHIVWAREEVLYSADALLGAKRSDERRDYLVVFQRNAADGVAEMTPHDVALALDVPPDKESRVRRMLRKMIEAGELRQPRPGYYAL